MTLKQHQHHTGCWNGHWDSSLDQEVTRLVNAHAPLRFLNIRGSGSAQNWLSDNARTARMSYHRLEREYQRTKSATTKQELKLARQQPQQYIVFKRIPQLLPKWMPADVFLIWKVLQGKNWKNLFQNPPLHFRPALSWTRWHGAEILTFSRLMPFNTHTIVA